MGFLGSSLGCFIGGAIATLTKGDSSGLFFGVIIYIFCTIWQIWISTKRMHDFNWSGWWAFGFLIPIFNIVLVIMCFGRKGTPGSNRFGKRESGK